MQLQLNDMNPGVNPYPDGLFWTTRVSPDAVVARPASGDAVYKVKDLVIRNYPDFGTALSGDPGVPATVSFEVRWFGVDQRLNIQDRDTGFGGEFVRGQAKMAWTATVGNFRFESDPIETSSSDFAELGTERNGVFFPRA